MTCRIELEMALHYACRPTPYAEHDVRQRTSPIVRDIHARWLRKGYIVPASADQKHSYGSEYTGTEALTVWTEALMKVPEPVKVERWEIPE